MNPEEQQILMRYFPENAVEMVAETIDKEQFKLRFTKSRRTKLGDFCPPKQKGDSCRITLNFDLHPYQMLITFVHEVAHKIAFDKYGRTIKPHGIQWENVYRELLQPYLIPSIFPQEIIQILQKSLIKVQATSSGDLELMRHLRSCLPKEENTLCLEDIPEGTKFCLPNGRTFVKYEKLRKRFKCQCLENRRWYIVNPLAKITIVESENQQEVTPIKKLVLKDLKKGTRFKISDGRVFIKHEKLQKRYKCQSEKTKKWFSIDPLMEVEIV